MDKSYDSLEASDENEEAVIIVEEIIEEILEQIVSGEECEETVLMSASKNILYLNSSIKTGKDRLPQQNESGYLSELDASVN